MSLLSIEDLTKEQIITLIKRALNFKKGAQLSIRQDIANIFLEPSTRTQISFQKAEQELGLRLYNLAIERSAFLKGESLEDTLLNLKAMGINLFVIRSREDYYWKKLNGNFAIINAGDGVSNHPSQALLDAMTIYEHFKTLDNLKIAVIGDFKHSRVYQSNKHLLTKFNCQVNGFGPQELGGNEQVISQKLRNYDVIIFLRIQHERLEQKYLVNDYNARFGLNAENVKFLNQKAIFLHPGPINRDVEIAANLLYDHPQNKILEQVSNGVNMRKAIIEFVCANL